MFSFAELFQCVHESMEDVDSETRKKVFLTMARRFVYKSALSVKELNAILEPYSVQIEDIRCGKCRNDAVIDTYQECKTCKLVGHTQCFYDHKGGFCNRKCQPQ
jgi:hypothetical protein